MIAFGLLGSMFFTLIAIPVLFVVVHHKLREKAQAKAQVKAVVAVLLACLALTSAANAETRRITLDEAVALATKQNSMVKMARLNQGDEGQGDRGARQLLPGAEQRFQRRAPSGP